MILSYLNTVVTRRDPAVLDLDVVRGVRELAVPVRPGALLPLELAAHLELQPPAFGWKQTGWRNEQEIKIVKGIS